LPQSESVKVGAREREHQVCSIATLQSESLKGGAMLVWSSGQWITTHTHTHTHTHTYNRKQARADVQGDIHSDTHTTSLQEPLLQIVEQDVLHILDMYEFLHVLRTICANSKLVRCYMNNKRIKAFQSISCKDTDVSAMTHSRGMHLRSP